MPSDCRNSADQAPLEALAAYWQWFSFAGADGPAEVEGGYAGLRGRRRSPGVGGGGWGSPAAGT